MQTIYIVYIIVSVLTSSYKSKVWWDEQEQAMRVICNGICGKEGAVLQIDSMNDIIAKQGGHIDRLIADMTTTKLFSIDAQILFSSFLRAKSVSNMAFFGTNKLIKAVINLIFELSDTKHCMQFFATEKEALTWLKTCK